MTENFLIWLKKYWPWLIIGPVAFLFFLGVSGFNFFTQSYNAGNSGYDFVKWASPDENANYLFTKLYAQTGDIKFFEKYNVTASDIIRPRSFRSDNGVIKPMSFLGIILIYGKIAGLTTYKLIPYLTPIFATLGLVYFYLLVKRIFDRNNALLSVVMLSFFPPYVYFSARSMFHNILFMSFLIIGLYYGYLMATSKARVCWVHALISGVIFGLAAATRTSELLWLAPLLIILWLFNIRQIGITKLIIFASAIIISFLPVLYYNKILYSSYILGGYAEMNQSIINIKDASAGLINIGIAAEGNQAPVLLNKIKNSVFFFGINTYKSAKMFYYYFVDMFPWLFWPALLGGIAFVLRWYKLKKRHLAYLVSLFFISIILIFYYGSWEFHDNPNAREHTIGNSYTRYWLPIYLGAIPLASLFILRLTRIISKLFRSAAANGAKKFISFKFSPILAKTILRIIIVLPLLAVSINFILFGSSEGLFYLGQRQLEARTEWERILDRTEKNSVVITQYHDKLIFPERKVVVGLFDDPNMIKEYARLTPLLPVYYYNFTFPDKTYEYLNRSRLADAGLRIEKISPVTGNFTLYRLFSIIATSSEMIK